MFNKAIILLLFITTSLISFSQNNENAKEIKTALLDKAEKTYGLDDRLINGLLYVNKHPRANKHPFFLNDQWKEGIVYINENVYKDLYLNYNIDTEEIILYHKFDNKRNIQIILNNNIIDSIQIANYIFINAKHLNLENYRSGFYELVYRGSFTAVKKHKKEFYEKYTTFDPHGTYSNTNTVLLFIMEKGDIIKIKNRSGILKQFSSIKRPIKRYLRNNGITYKKINKHQLFKLLQYCDEHSSN